MHPQSAAIMLYMAPLAGRVPNLSHPPSESGKLIALLLMGMK
jgi:hypothetical protein